MRKNYNLVTANITWELTNLPKDHKSVGYQWVFHTKKDASSEIIIYRAQLVVEGFC